jgi:hypothetical protein
MGIGPFPSFVFPGVYSQTLDQAPTATAAGELRIPAFIGVAADTIPVPNYEMIRGSSSMADNPVNENVSSQFTGSERKIQTTYYPIVKGDGNGTTTNNTNDIVVTVNGNPVPVASVTGASGEIYLVEIPSSGDAVLVGYYFKRKDDLHTAEDISDQADGVNVTFQTHYYPIVKGDNGGTTTTDPSNIVITIDGTTTPAIAVNGDTGHFTLASASAPTYGQTVLVTYYSNEDQHTSDILPSPYVASIDKVGYAPGTSDFINGTDFILDTTGAFSTINWGQSCKIAAGTHTIGYTYFDDSVITGTLYDNRNFRRLSTTTPDSTKVTFAIGAIPVTGEGLAIPTENPLLLGDIATPGKAFFGASPTDATSVEITTVEATVGTIQVSDQTTPLVGTNVYITAYSNILRDDVWTLTDASSGGIGTGYYTIMGASSGVAMNVQYIPGPSSDTSVADPSFIASDAGDDFQVIPGYAVKEKVELTFADATSYLVSSSVSNGTGSSGDNTGYLNQTYIDKKTGFRVTLNDRVGLTYIATDHIGYNVSPLIPVSATPTRAIPGLKVTVATTEGLNLGDTGIINTYARAGSEPNTGDFYYVSYEQTKQYDANGLTTAAVYTNEQNVINSTGSLTINNKLGLAAHLAFLNGATAIILLQIEKTSGGTDAPDSRYIAGIDYFNEPLPGNVRPVLIEPITTSSNVITYLKTSNIIQSGIRYGNEHMSYFGFALNTSPTTAQMYAKAINCERMIAIYPDGGITTLTDALGNDVEYLVDGSLLAAAVAGRDVSPAFDVAEPITKKPITGITRLYRRLDSVTAAQTANAGITLLEELAAGIQIKFGLTTDVSSVLTRTPSIIRTKDFVQRGARAILSPYIGTKLLTQRTSEIVSTLTSYLSSLQQAQIITAYNNVTAVQDPNDPTIINAQAFYSPIFPLLWIVITFNLRSSV